MTRLDRDPGVDSGDSKRLRPIHGEEVSGPTLEALLSAVEAGLAGEAPLARQRVQRILRKTGPETESNLRARLARLLSNTPTPYQPLRTGDPTSAWEIGQPTRRFPQYDSPSEPLGSELLVPSPQHAVVPPVLSPAAWVELNQTIKEHRLAEAGQLSVVPTRTLLLTGPPGTGKTMTAAYLASALDRPLLTLNLAATVASELGQTGSNIRSAFSSAARLDAVLFIDELDAIAGRRADVGDVGEARRIVNVLLLELDRWPAGPLLVAATNHPELLDPAVWRRFETVIDLQLPGPAERLSLVQLGLSGTEVGSRVAPAVVDAVAAASDGLSAADIITRVRRAARRAEVNDLDLGRSLLFEVVSDRGEARGDVTDILYAILHEEGLSLREIARMFDTTHPTVSAGERRGRRALARGSAIQKGQT